RPGPDGTRRGPRTLVRARPPRRRPHLPRRRRPVAGLPLRPQAAVAPGRPGTGRGGPQLHPPARRRRSRGVRRLRRTSGPGAGAATLAGRGTGDRRLSPPTARLMLSPGAHRAGRTRRTGFLLHPRRVPDTWRNPVSFRPFTRDLRPKARTDEIGRAHV